LGAARLCGCLSSHSGISLEKEAGPGAPKPRYQRLIPALAPGVAITSIEKFEQIDREGLEIHYASGTRHWSQIIVMDD
jgi:hypothetical protein